MISVSWSSEWKNRNTRVDWNGDDHNCYPNKCGPSKEIIQGDKGQSNLGSVEKGNTNLY